MALNASQSGATQAMLYVRLKGQPEVYACRATSPQYLGGTIHDYRSNCLLNLAASPHRMVMQLRDTTLVAQLDTGVWHVGTLSVADAAAWQAYTQALRHPCSNDFVGDLDELALDSLLYWQLTLYTPDDSVSVSCYRDTQQVPIICYTPPSNPTFGWEAIRPGCTAFLRMFGLRILVVEIYGTGNK